MKYTIPQPPDSIFLYERNVPAEVFRENRVTFLIDSITTTKGVLVYYRGAKHPKKGFPYPEAVEANNVMKRTLVLMLEFPLWSLVFKFKKLLPKINEFGMRIMRRHLLKQENMIIITSELQGLIQIFFSRLGVDDENANRLGLLLSHTLEYDDAYRTRLQDIITECSERALIEDPRKEIKRLMEIYKEREPDQYVARKMGKIVSWLSLLLLVPKVRKAFRSTIRAADFRKLKRDESDQYWILNRGDYNFMGMSYEQRIAMMDPAPQGFLITPE